MKVITYLGFTLLSIFIQFSVMDFIQEKMQVEDSTKGKDSTVSSLNPKFKDLLKNLTNKPHLVYRRTAASQNNKETVSKRYINTSLLEVNMATTTELSTTILDILYDENTSITEYAYTTESIFSSTEFENVTEITLFNKNTTNIKPKTIPKETKNANKCGCDLLYKTCDINCCCDNDCSDEDRRLFIACQEDDNINKEGYCFPHLHYFKNRPSIANIEDLFCIVKTNLPKKKNINKYNMYDTAAVDRVYKWSETNKLPTLHVFAKKLYTYGDPVWLLRNGSIVYIDLPTSVVNNYCTGRRAIQFLKDEKHKCNVKFNDLEMFQVIKAAEETTVLSAIEDSLNSSTVNCSTFHCTNWTVVVCDQNSCMPYNKTLHEPACTDTYCTGLALKMDYIFYYYDSKIMNATIRFHTQKMSTVIPFMTQEIKVTFLIANESIENIVQLSGNPGYRSGLPVIASYAESNYTESFYNKTLKMNSNLFYPASNKGICILSNTTNNIVTFGINKRTKCRLIHNTHDILANRTNICQRFEKDISEILYLNEKSVVSPLGNPGNMKDKDWIPMQIVRSDEDAVYGHLNDNNSKLYCYGLVTRISFVFTFADVSDAEMKRENKILAARVEVFTRNVTFNMDDISTVLTIDTNFVDVTKPKFYEYAGSPQLNIHLPEDFFFPFSSNKCYTHGYNSILLFCLLMAILQIK